MKKYYLVFLLFIFFTSLICSEEIQKPVDRWLSKDKFSHLTASTFLYCWNFELLNNGCQMDRNSSRVFAISITEFWGLAKEIHDSKKENNHFSYKDLAFNTLGCAIGILICNQQ
ncbi:MAG: DUF2279 domain-containing protein [Candidatus Cloacimonetes bacterium]|nr:DUF2279 domain-containing protein [Candidatus Cloacimonadota bacterium]MBL7107937.1 DUF2279 domain-containing protein [Candidatus Cloacimonadota bacterium]